MRTPGIGAMPAASVPQTVTSAPPSIRARSAGRARTPSSITNHSASGPARSSATSAEAASARSTPTLRSILRDLDEAAPFEAEQLGSVSPVRLDVHHKKIDGVDQLPFRRSRLHVLRREVGTHFHMRVVDDPHRSFAAQALIHEPQIFEAEGVRLARGAWIGLGVEGVHLVLLVLAAPHLSARQ